MPKQSRLAKIFKNKMAAKLAAILFYDLKTGLFRPDFKWSTSLDRFINKGHKKYFIHAKTV